MSELVARGGSSTQERIKHHNMAIVRHALYSFALAVPIRSVDKVLNRLILPRSLGTPYLFAWPYLIDTVMRYCSDKGVTEPIDFIFDNQSDAAHLIAREQAVFAGMKAQYDRRMSNFPICRSDDEFLPLQAADLLAWIMRKKYLATGNISGNYNEFPWGERMYEPPGMTAQLDEAHLFDYAYHKLSKYFVTLDGKISHREIPITAFRPPPDSCE